MLIGKISCMPTVYLQCTRYYPKQFTCILSSNHVVNLQVGLIPIWTQLDHIVGVTGLLCSNQWTCYSVSLI